VAASYFSGALVARSGDRAPFRPALHPAGIDTELRAAVDEVRMGRWARMQNLLTDTGRNWPLRTARSQVLASAAVRSHAVREWLRDEPECADALMMRARVGTELVLRAHRNGHDVSELVPQAREAALDAGSGYPADPVPWVCLLAQAQTDVDRTMEAHRQLPPERMLPPGPWGLLARARERDLYNREAHHRMLQFLLAAPSRGVLAGVNFAHWVRDQVPADSHSALLVLPLYAHAEYHRERRTQGRYDRSGLALWGTDLVRFDTSRALSWFTHNYATAASPKDLTYPSPLDLNFLAHALWADHKYAEAAPVFEKIGPHMTPTPWTHVSARLGDEDSVLAEFDKARRQCMSSVDGSWAARAGPKD